jgi:hypothetical protein
MNNKLLDAVVWLNAGSCEVGKDLKQVLVFSAYRPSWDQDGVSRTESRTRGCNLPVHPVFKWLQNYRYKEEPGYVKVFNHPSTTDPGNTNFLDKSVQADLIAAGIVFQQVTLKAGDIYVIPAGCPHFFQTEKNVPHTSFAWVCRVPRPESAREQGK